jgi:uncharacterized membrane protein
MQVGKAFSRGWDIYKKNFFELFLLNASRVFAMVAFVLVSVLLAIPLVVSGASQLIASPESLIVVPGMLESAAYLVSYFLVIAALAVLTSPLFLYPHLAGSVLALKKKVKVEQAFKVMKSSYLKLLLDTMVYWAIVLFLFAESMFLMMASPLLGILLSTIAVYVSVRLTFWDTLIFMGEEHPLAASWKITKGKFWGASLFVLSANLILQLCLLVPSRGFPLCFLIAPFVTTSKAAFVSGMREGFNKKRR